MLSRNGEFPKYVLPRITKITKPIYDLTRQGWQFIWGKEQQDAFEEIKCRLIKPQMLHVLNSTGRFHLYTIKICYGEYTLSNTKIKPNLIAYASKGLTEVAKITPLQS